MNKMYEEPEYDIEPEYPERFHWATNFPEIPVVPENLFNIVSAKLQSYKLQVPTKSKEMIEDMCKTFNECIRLNNSKEIAKTLVLSPKTGSAKSVTAKAYIALLQSESSLVIVPTVKDANDFCKDINNWSGDSNYARCHYSISNDNPQSMYYADKANLANHRCIVITHAMYILINKNQSSKLFEVLKLIGPKLVIIDERISLYNRYTITSKEVNDLIELFTSIDSTTNYELKDDISKLEEIATIFKKLNEEASKISKSNLILPIKKQKDIVAVQFASIYEVLEDKIIDINNHISSLGQVKSKSKQEIKTHINELLEIIKRIGVENFSFHKSGTYDTILFTSNIEAHFGSSVVLDATATINEIYNNTTYYKSNKVHHIMTVDPRVYNNFTIYKAVGYPQGKETIYKNQKASDYRTIATNYIRLAQSLLTELTDNILIVTFKDFAEELNKLNKSTSRISITNWGNHVGKNKWSDCNKVMIIGWYKLPSYEYYGNYIDSMNSPDIAAYNNRNNTTQKFERTQIIDDLVQATMRCSARKIVDTNGDCKKSEAYLFYPDDAEGHDIIKNYINEFKGAKVIDWNPKELLTTKKLSNSTNNVDTIFEYLTTKLTDPSIYVKNSDIIEDTALTKTVVNRTISSKKFTEKLKLSRFERRQINKQSKAFFIK